MTIRQRPPCQGDGEEEIRYLVPNARDRHSDVPSWWHQIRCPFVRQTNVPVDVVLGSVIYPMKFSRRRTRMRSLGQNFFFSNWRTTGGRGSHNVWGLLRIELKEIRISTMALLPSSENAAPQMQFSSTGTTDERLGRCVRCASAQAESHSIESPVDV